MAACLHNPADRRGVTTAQNWVLAAVQGVSSNSVGFCKIVLMLETFFLMKSALLE